MGSPMYSLLCRLWVCVMLEEGRAMGGTAVDVGLHMGRRWLEAFSWGRGKGRAKEAECWWLIQSSWAWDRFSRQLPPCSSSLGWLSLLCSTLSSVKVRVTESSCLKEGRGSSSWSEGAGLWCGWNRKPTHPLPSLLAASRSH